MIPNRDDVTELDNLVAPIFDSISANEQENQTLSTLRDALLSRLMSGEIDVSCITKLGEGEDKINATS